MSDPQQVDYDAIAKKHGALPPPDLTVPAPAAASQPQPASQDIDYDAIAAKHGAIPAESDAPPPKAKAVDTISAGPKPFTLPWLKSKFYTGADAVSEGLPAAGATAGALIGGGVATPAAPGVATAAGAIGGAGIGGMGGEALRQIIRRSLGFDAPATSADAANGIAKEGAIQGSIQAGTEALGPLGPMLRKTALTQYSRALAPTKAVNKAIVQKIAPEMIDRGISGSLESIEKQGAQGAAAVKPELDAAYAAMHPSSTAGSGNQIVQDLENLKGKYMVNGVPGNPTAVDAITGVQDIVRQHGADIDPTSLRKLKGIFDDPVAAKGGFAGNDLSTAYAAKAQKAAGDSIRRIVHSASPDVGALDKEVSFWLNVQKVARESGLRRTGQEGGLLKTLAPLGSATAAAAGFMGHGAAPSIEAATGSFLATHAALAMRTPQWRTASAVFKDRFADALASGNVGDVLALSARLGVAAPGVMKAMNPQNQTEQPSAEAPPTQ